MLRTAVIGAGSLGRQHARIHAALAAEGHSQFTSVCDLNEETARNVSSERKTKKREMYFMNVIVQPDFQCAGYGCANHKSRMKEGSIR